MYQRHGVGHDGHARVVAQGQRHPGVDAVEHLDVAALRAWTAWVTVAKRRSTISMGRSGASTKYRRLPVKTVSSGPFDSSTMGPLGGGWSAVFDFRVLRQHHLQQALGADVGPVQGRLDPIQSAARHFSQQVGPLGRYPLLPGSAISSNSRATSGRSAPAALGPADIRPQLDEQLVVMGSVLISPTGQTYLPPSARAGELGQRPVEAAGSSGAPPSRRAVRAGS